MRERVEITAIVKGIVETEWKMLQQSESIDNTHVPMDAETFFILRSSQIMAWSTEMQESYYFDVVQAHRDGRNPLKQKYAYLLEQTEPAQFEELYAQLPKRSAREEEMIDQLCALRIAWRNTLTEQYPRFCAHVFRQTNDRTLETTLRGEMAACTANTLRLYALYAARLQKDGKNMEEMILQNAAAQYGYASLAEAEDKLRK